MEAVVGALGGTNFYFFYYSLNETMALDTGEKGWG